MTSFRHYEPVGARMEGELQERGQLHSLTVCESLALRTEKPGEDGSRASRDHTEVNTVGFTPGNCQHIRFEVHSLNHPNQ